MTSGQADVRSTGSVLEVFLAFVKLGLTSFGGPVAHMGYFRDEFVLRRRWLDEKGYADLVALCQFLPGPASSQVGMALGLQRAGWLGALAAWVGFTAPSALAMILFALGVLSGAGWETSGVVHGLKVMAVAVVAQAVLGMSKSLCADRLRAGVAIGAALMVWLLPSLFTQILVLALGGLIGWRALALPHLPAAQHQDCGVNRTTGAFLLTLCVLLLLALPALTAWSDSYLWAALASF